MKHKDVQFFYEQEPILAKESRKLYLEGLMKEKLADLLEDLFDILKAIHEKDETVVILMWTTRRIDAQIKKLRSIVNEFFVMKGDKLRQKDFINLAEIEMARQVEPSAIMEVDKKGMALCPEHDDSVPSMLTTNGFLYCFACGYRSDIIGYIMKTQNISFPSAVKHLLAHR